jgi:DNA-binding protein H-NS
MILASRIVSLGLVMKDRELDKMALDDLWDLNQRIIEVLERKLESEKRKLQNQLDELGRKFGGSPGAIPQRRPYPEVKPKYRNPNIPSEMWSGRGKTPRWVAEWLAAGRNLDELRIQ